MATNNSINCKTTGIVGYNGSTFDGTAVTQHAVLVGGSTSDTVTSLSVGTNNSILVGNTGADPAFSTTATIYINGISWNAGTNSITSFTEGTWTPTVTLATPGTSSITYTAQVGRYFQLGSLVMFESLVNILAYTQGSGSGNVRLSSLPFTSANVANQTTACPAWFTNVTFETSGTYIQADIPANSTFANWVNVLNGGTAANIQANHITANSIIHISGTYSTA